MRESVRIWLLRPQKLLSKPPEASLSHCPTLCTNTAWFCTRHRKDFAQHVQPDQPCQPAKPARSSSPQSQALPTTRMPTTLASIPSPLTSAPRLRELGDNTFSWVSSLIQQQKYCMQAIARQSHMRQSQYQHLEDTLQTIRPRAHPPESDQQQYYHQQLAVNCSHAHTQQWSQRLESKRHKLKAEQQAQQEQSTSEACTQQLHDDMLRAQRERELARSENERRLQEEEQLLRDIVPAKTKEVQQNEQHVNWMQASIAAQPDYSEERWEQSVCRESEYKAETHTLQKMAYRKNQLDQALASSKFLQETSRQSMPPPTTPSSVRSVSLSKRAHYFGSEIFP